MHLRASYWIKIGVVVAVLLLSSGLIYLGAGASSRPDLLAHLYYVPIVVAAFMFGPVGGVLTAAAAAVLTEPALAGVRPVGANGVLIFMTQALLFALVGATVGMLTQQLRGALTRERRQRDQLDVLHEIDKAILRDLSLESLFEQVVAATAHLFDAALCRLYVARETDGELTSTSSWTGSGSGSVGNMNGRAASVNRWIEDEVARRAFSGQQFVVCAAPNGRLPREAWSDLESRGVHAVMAAPLVHNSLAVGALVVGADSTGFSPAEQADLSRIAHQLAIAVKSAEQIRGLQRMGQEILSALMEAIEQRDLYTSEHIDRVESIAVALAHDLGLTPGEIQTVKYAAQLHDIGKLATPTEILQQPGPLSEQQWQIVRRHPVVGSRILEQVSFLREAAPLVRHHHEWFNGAGYPDGLCGRDIPVGARIIAVADAFDAMTSDRPYRSALTVDEAVAELTTHAGTQFDPEVVASFVDVMNLPPPRVTDRGVVAS